MFLIMIGSATAAVIALTGYVDAYSRISEQSQVLARQENEILAQRAAVDAQRSEIESKALELEQIQSRLDSLTRELDEKEAALQEETSNVAVLEEEVISLTDQAIVLQAQISTLQSKSQSDEELIIQLSSSQAERVAISHYGVGVDQNNEGTVFPIRVEIIKSGSGILSVDINNVQYEPGFQTAVRAAAEAASRYSGESISDKDIVVRFAYEDGRFGGEPAKVDGSSAGAIIAAMIAAGLADKEIDSSLLVTGSIDEDGTLGRVGSIEEKIVAAHAFGADAMLVPESQEFESETLPVVGVADIAELMERLTG
jgi:PDZ domain-containing secreted protein